MAGFVFFARAAPTGVVATEFFVVLAFGGGLLRSHDNWLNPKNLTSDYLVDAG